MTIQKTPTIHKAPFIYKQGNGGGGGGTNPDGSKRVTCIYNSKSDYIFNTGITLKNTDYIKCIYRLGVTSNMGVFSLKSSKWSYPILALVNSSPYIYMKDANWNGGASLSPSIDTAQVVFFEHIDKQTNKAYNQKGQYCENLTFGENYQEEAGELRFFKGSSSYDSGFVEIFYFKSQGSFNCELLPSVKNGVAGFYDSVNDNFLPVNNNEAFAIPWD